MGYRCANDLFYYCSDKPDWGKSHPGGGSCQLDPKTCGKHQTLREQVGDRIAQPKEGTYKPKKVKKGK